MVITVIGTIIFSIIAIIANYLFAGNNNQIKFKSLGVLGSEEYVGIFAFVYSN